MRNLGGAFFSIKVIKQGKGETSLIRKPWLTGKFIAAILVLLILFTASASIGPVYAATLGSSYDVLKNDPDNQEFIQRILMNGATADQLKSFLDDMDAEVAKAGTITEANFDSVMYQALNEVITWRKNRAILQSLMIGFSAEIDYTLANHLLHPNLVPLRNAVKAAVLGSSTGGGEITGGGTIDDDEKDAITTEIERQLGLSGRTKVSLDTDPILGSIVIPKAAFQKIINSGRDLQISAYHFTMTIPAIALPTSVSADQTIIVLDLSSSESAEVLKKRSENLVVLGKVYEITSSPEIDWVKPVSISISFSGSNVDGVKTDTISIYYYNENKKEWEKISSTADLTAQSIRFTTSHFSKYAVMAEAAGTAPVPVIEPVPKPADPAACAFTDINGHWAQSIIQKMAASGMVSGMSATQFAPERTVTRAEFATLLVKMLGIKSTVQLMGRFNDVSKDKWYFSTVNTAANAGIISGYSATRFGPEDPVTREQMAVMIAKAMAYKGKNNVVQADSLAVILGSFQDQNRISSWARSSIALIVQEKIMKGRGNAEFAPGAKATRAEATVLMYQMGQNLGIIK